MSKTYKPAQPFTESPRPQISLARVDSSQIHSVGYDGSAHVLAIRFNAPGQRDKPATAREGGEAIYHYPNVSPVLHAEFIGSDSIGRYFGLHIDSLPFEKYRAELAPA